MHAWPPFQSEDCAAREVCARPRQALHETCLYRIANRSCAGGAVRNVSSRLPVGLIGISSADRGRQRDAEFAEAGPNSLLDAADWMMTAASSDSRNPRAMRSCAAIRT